MCFLRGEGTGHIVPICPPMFPSSPQPWRRGLYLGLGTEKQEFPKLEEEAWGGVDRPRKNGAPGGAVGLGLSWDARVKDEAGDILLGHAWQLMGEDILQPHEPEQHPPVGLGRQRVADDMELDDATTFLQAGCLVPGCIG